MCLLLRFTSPSPARSRPRCPTSDAEEARGVGERCWQHTEPDNAMPRPTAALIPLCQRQALPHGQGVHRRLHPDGIQESAPEEKTPETGGLQKGSLELVLQQRGEPLLLSSSHRQKNKCRRPALLASLENGSGANPRRASAQPDEQPQHSPKPEGPSPAAHHVLSRESTQELPAEFRCKDGFASKPPALVLQRRRGGAVPGSATTSAS